MALRIKRSPSHQFYKLMDTPSSSTATNTSINWKDQPAPGIKPIDHDAVTRWRLNKNNTVVTAKRQGKPYKPMTTLQLLEWAFWNLKPSTYADDRPVLTCNNGAAEEAAYYAELERGYSHDRL